MTTHTPIKPTPEPYGAVLRPEGRSTRSHANTPFALSAFYPPDQPAPIPREPGLTDPHHRLLQTLTSPEVPTITLCEIHTLTLAQILRETKKAPTASPGLPGEVPEHSAGGGGLLAKRIEHGKPAPEPHEPYHPMLPKTARSKHAPKEHDSTAPWQNPDARGTSRHDRRGEPESTAENLASQSMPHTVTGSRAPGASERDLNGAAPPG